MLKEANILVALLLSNKLNLDSFCREKEKFDLLKEQQAAEEGGKKQKKKKKNSTASSAAGGAGGASGSRQNDWTWKDQVDMVKWTDRMINVRF